MTTSTDIWENADTLPTKSECEFRTKISRAYYALFSHALEFHAALSSEGNLLKDNSGVHSKLSQMLTNPTVKDAELENHSRLMGTHQRLAHEIRVKADYRLEEVVTYTDVIKCIGYVKKGLAIPIPAAGK